VRVKVDEQPRERFGVLFGDPVAGVGHQRAGDILGQLAHHRRVVARERLGAAAGGQHRDRELSVAFKRLTMDAGVVVESAVDLKQTPHRPRRLEGAGVAVDVVLRDRLGVVGEVVKEAVSETTSSR